MKTDMTERDKKLLTFMFLIVIIVGIGYWGIRPQVKRFIELEPKIQAQEDLKSVNQLKIANVMLVEEQVEEYEALIAERKDEFYQILTSSEVDRMMTEMAINNNLEIYELSFNMPNEPSNRSAYQYSELKEWQDQMAASYKSEDEDEDLLALTNKSSDKESDEDEDVKVTAADKQKIMDEVMVDDTDVYQANTDIYAVPVTITVAGELEDLEAFKEDILAIEKRTLLTSYSWGEYREVVTDSGSSIEAEATEASEEGVSSEEIEETYKVVTRKTLTVKLEIFMCDTSNIEDVETDSETESTEESGDADAE